ncbi:hypothetical protein XENTR_v10023450 [Xenopus tropicalis]|nr:hypothetical protein XENTR_v10023450 [Xenopus tropicalis]
MCEPGVLVPPVPTLQIRAKVTCWLRVRSVSQASNKRSGSSQVQSPWLGPDCSSQSIHSRGSSSITN